MHKVILNSAGNSDLKKKTVINYAVLSPIAPIYNYYISAKMSENIRDV